MWQTWLKRLQVGRFRFGYIVRTFRIFWAISPFWMSAHIALALANGILPIISVSLTESVVESILTLVESGSAFVTIAAQVAPPIILFALISLFSRITATLANTVYRALTYRSSDYMSDALHRQTIRLDLAYFDRTEYYDLLNRATSEANTQPLAMLMAATQIGSGVVTMVGLLVLLVSYGLWLPLAVFISTLPSFLIIRWHSRRVNQWRVDTTQRQRLMGYYGSLLTGLNSAAEMRLFQLGEHYASAYLTLSRKMRQEMLRFDAQFVFADFLAYTLAFAAVGVIMVWMLIQTVVGAYGLGDLVAFYRILSRGQAQTTRILDAIGDLYRAALFLQHLYTYLDLQPNIQDPPDPQPMGNALTHGITFENITFSYPEAPRKTLENFTLHIPSGQLVAIVGPNGSGKSTLIKLLCRFYDPQGGSVLWDGVDIRRYRLADLWRQTTVLFQVPMRYQTTARENITLGDLTAPRDDAAVELAAQAAGAHERIIRLEKGYDTVLGRMFGTGELSVGEWQRLALARAFWRQSPLIILDEPTSAMDVWAEAAWLDSLRATIAGRTALLITHRFTTAMKADWIYVMKDGKLLEQGTHADLLQLSGIYAQSWEQQTRSAQDALTHRTL